MGKPHHPFCNGVEDVRQVQFGIKTSCQVADLPQRRLAVSLQSIGIRTFE